MLKLKKVFRNKKVLGSLLVVIGVVGFYQIFISQGSNYSWIQSDWSGGADEVAVATHTTNQTGWTKFFSKDDNVDVTTTPGEIALTEPAYSEDLYTTDADFNAMEQTDNHSVDGGFYINGDSIQLKKQAGASCTVDGECVEYCHTGVCGFDCGTDTVTYGGQTYNTVLIGTQCWFKENLNIGTMVTGATTMTNNSIIEKYCYSNTESNCTTYGGLYQWNEAMQYSLDPGVQGICPVGWHIPTDAEQHQLDLYLTDEGNTCNPDRSDSYDCSPAGTRLKPGGSSGFEGLLAGYRGTGGSFDYLSSYAFFWSSSVSGSFAWRRFLGSSHTTVRRSARNQTNGLSVRCLKD
jgi:uncharacterized protein (TIGR02145 family)